MHIMYKLRRGMARLEKKRIKKIPKNLGGNEGRNYFTNDEKLVRNSKSKLRKPFQ